MIVYDGSSTAEGIKVYFNNVNQSLSYMSLGTYVAMENSGRDLYIAQDGHLTFAEIYLDELKIYNYAFNEIQRNNEYNSYFTGNNTLTFLSKDLYNRNMSVFKNGEYKETIKYTDSLKIDNLCDYTFILHETVLDEFTDITNIDNLAEKNISSIMYILIIFMIIGLIIYFIRR